MSDLNGNGSQSASQAIYRALDAMQAADEDLAQAQSAVTRCYEEVRNALANLAFKRRSAVAAAFAHEQGDVAQGDADRAISEEAKASNHYGDALVALCCAEMRRAAMERHRQSAGIHFDEAVSQFRTLAD